MGKYILLIAIVISACVSISAIDDNDEDIQITTSNYGEDEFSPNDGNEMLDNQIPSDIKIEDIFRPPVHSDVKSSDVVETSSGKVSGIRLRSAVETDVDVFYGIPYATPPVGKYRFQPPKKVDPWKDTYAAVKPTSACYQQIPGSFKDIAKMLRSMSNRDWSEDCLTLNVWAPSQKTQKTPVFVYIHGGGFVLGSSLMMTDGTTLVSEGFVVVSMNYRLGVFGFLSLGNPSAPGNLGLMDQNLAMQWVKENIEAFGGDPESITIIGVSAGSASVGFHLLSPKSKGLFNRAVMIAGAPNSVWATKELEYSVKSAKKFLQDLGCPADNVTLALSCGQGKHADDLLDAAKPHDLFDNPFVPTVDGDFITEHPSISVAAGNFNPGEVIMGSAADEGTAFMVMANPNLFKTGDGRLLKRNYVQVIQKIRPDLSDLQVEALKVAYTSWNNPDDPIMLRDAARKMYGDGVLVCDHDEFGDSLARSGHSVYRYVFDYKIPNPFMKGVEWAGPEHGSEHMPLLGPGAMLAARNEMGKVLARFRHHIENFARNGDPNLPKDEYPDEPHWPKFNRGQINLFSKSSSIRSNLRTQECAVWLKLLPLLDSKTVC